MPLARCCGGRGRPMFCRSRPPSPPRSTTRSPRYRLSRTHEAGEFVMSPVHVTLHASASSSCIFYPNRGFESNQTGIKKWLCVRERERERESERKRATNYHVGEITKVYASL
jgi:hypothetical protein